MIKLVMFLILASCASPKNVANCVEKKDEKFLVEKLTTILSTIKGSPLKLKEIERSCHKIKYQAFDKVQVIVYRLPGMKNTLSSTVNYTEPVLRQACWDKALMDIFEIDKGNRYQKLMELHQKMNPFEWKDLDVGPSKWVKCGLDDQEIYYSSLVTLVHEVNHEIKTFKDNQVCLYLLEKQDYICFQFDKDLPRRSLGRLDLNIIPFDAGRESLTHLQDVYLLNIDQEIWSLLDELNAYGISARTMTRILEVKGNAHIFREGKRNMAIVSMFQLIVKRYFERLKEKNLRAYEKVMAQNRKHLQILLQDSNDAYLEWLRVIARNNEKEKKAELTFRKLFTHASPFFTDIGWSPK
jgi:hypothetical protein